MSPRTGRRSRASAPELVTIFWRDIPAQITARKDDERVKVLLDARFQHAIDRAAMVADMSDTQSYVGEWRRQAVAFDGAAQAAADAAAQAVESEYPAEKLEAIVRAGGVDDTKLAALADGA